MKNVLFSNSFWISFCQLYFSINFYISSVFKLFVFEAYKSFSKYASGWKVYYRANCFWWKPNHPFDSPLFFYSMMMFHLLFILVFFKICHHWFFSSILPPNINPMWLSDQLTLYKLIAKWIEKLTSLSKPLIPLNPCCFS